MGSKRNNFKVMRKARNLKTKQMSEHMRKINLARRIERERNQADQAVLDIQSKSNKHKDQSDANKFKTLRNNTVRVSTYTEVIKLVIKSFFRIKCKVTMRKLSTSDKRLDKLLEVSKRSMRAIMIV